MAELTAKQKRFGDEYLIDLNAKQAAIRAGYSANTAEQQASRLLSNVKVQEYIKQQIEKRENRTGITQDRVLKEYARLGFFDPRKLFDDDGKPIPINQLDDDTAAAIAGLDVLEEYEGNGEERTFVGYTKKYKVADKIAALNSIAKHLGMFVEKVEHSGGIHTTDLTDLSPEERRARINELVSRRGNGASDTS